MIHRKERSRSRKTHCFTRALRHEWLEGRNLMAGDIVDTPVDPNIDTSSGQAEVRAAIDFEGDIDALRLNVSNYDSFAAGAWKATGEPLKLRVLDATGQDVSGTVVDPSGVISLVGSAEGQYSLQISSETDEAAEYIVRVKTWSDGVSIPPDSSEPGGEDPTGRDPANREPDIGIPDGSEPDGRGSDGTKPDGQRPDDDIISIYLRDGVYYFGEEPKRPEGDSSSGSDSEVVMLEGWSPDRQSPDGDVDIKPIICDGMFLPRGDLNPVEGISASGEEPGVGNSDGSKTDGRRPDDDSEIRIYLRDGVYYYGNEGEPPADGSSSIDGESDGERGVRPVWQEGIMLRMHNEVTPADVNGDSSLTPLDALVLINLLNTRGGGSVSSYASWAQSQGAGANGSTFVDTNNDGFISPLDVLFVINQLNSRVASGTMAASAGGENSSSKDAAFANVADWIAVPDVDDEEELGLFADVPLA